MKPINLPNWSFGSLILALLFLFAACSGGDSDSLEMEGVGADGAKLGGDAMKVYTLPSPLQIASALKVFDLDYDEALLNPTINSTANYPTAFSKSLNIGIYGIDMGYTTVYEQKQEAIHYLSIIEKLALDLNLGSAFSGEMVRRFEENIDRQDSLYRLILAGFGQAHRHLQENEREDVGLLVITGSFVEGLYLLTRLSEQRATRKLVNMVGQQKIYLENLIELLSKYSDQQEVATLISKLDGLMEDYQGIQVTYDEGGQIANDVQMTDVQMNKIKATVSEIRADIVGQ
jgi:hypothetical protein